MPHIEHSHRYEVEKSELSIYLTSFGTSPTIRPHVALRAFNDQNFWEGGYVNDDAQLAALLARYEKTRAAGERCDWEIAVDEFSKPRQPFSSDLARLGLAALRSALIRAGASISVFFQLAKEARETAA